MLLNVISFIGVMIPGAGLVALFLKEHQSKVSTYLMFTNIGCLIMNGAYLFSLKAKSFEEVMMGQRMQYIGNVLFYFFFILFLLAYFHIRFPRWIVWIWAVIQSVELIFMWIDNFNHFLLEHIFFRIQDDIGIYSMQFDSGVVHMIRYCFTCVMLQYMLIYTIVRIFMTRVPSERNNLARLAGAQFVVIMTLVLMLLFRFPYDAVPIFSSLSILSIVLSVISGDFFSITDMGHEWVFEQMEDAFVVVDSMYGYLDANSHARRLFPELNKKAKNKRIPTMLYQIFTDEKKEQEVNGRYYDKKITEITQEGKLVGYSLFLADITRQHFLMEELKTEKERADEANQAKSAFLSNMSHDIRTPMNAIVGFAALMDKDADKPDKVREYTRKITFSSQHLLNLINDILDMSKIESGKTTLNMEEFSLPELLEALYVMMLPQAKAKKQKFELRTGGKLPEIVVGDKLRLNQVLINLLSNAVKYTQEGGTIEVRAEILGQEDSGRARLRFVVKDNGYGMSEEFVKTIFEPFSRETTGSTKEIQGTGLGTAITKSIVDLMGGTILVESKLEQGSTFTVELELAAAGRPQDKRFWISHNISHILVVDKEEEICLNIRELMEDAGVSVDYALDGGRAVDMALQEKYQIVLTDDVETAEQIKEKLSAEAPLLGLAAYDIEEKEDMAHTAGINFFMSKPFFVSSFRRAVAQAFGDGERVDASSGNQSIDLSGLKVLAAEDNEINQEILLELMKAEGVECDMASDGQEALDKFLASSPGQYDMIFMDVHMPVMDGYAAARAIRASAHAEAGTIPIIAMTADAFDEDVKKALEAGMNAHTAKPVDMDKLKATIVRIRKENEAAAL